MIRAPAQRNFRNFMVMTAPADKSLKKARVLSFEAAEEERMQYSLKKTVPERLEYLQRLRVLNYGEKAKLPIARKIQVLLMPD
jgi:hypothetical protein